jgi:ATP-binding cassette subfamily B multidrug efflux pump
MGMLWPTLETMLGFAVVLVLWIGGREVLNGRMTVGSFVAFNTYMVQLTWPIIALGWVINIFQRGTASMGRINEILIEGAEIDDRDARLSAPPIKGGIEFRNLTFAYNGTTVLADVNLRIPAGSSLAIVGPTGSGKTTLVSLIPRIYDATPDAVLIDGRPVREYPLHVLRRSVGFVPQETFLFSESIRENISFGVEGADDEAVRTAAAAANIAGDIEGFAEQYQTMVGERGITLSGGQKQRIAIARAILRDAPLLLLDEATSSLDAESETLVQKALERLMQARTTLVIAHRLATVLTCDRILVMDNGRLVEEGTHARLAAAGGLYARLARLQFTDGRNSE